MSKHHHDEGHEINTEYIGHHGNAYENRDLGGRGIIVFLIVLVVSGFVISLMVWGYYGYAAKHQSTAAPLTATQEPALPAVNGNELARFKQQHNLPVALQDDDVRDMNQMLENENNVLTSYGWVDRNSGIVHIPLDEAMKAVVKQGLPARPAQQPATKAAEFGSGVNTPAGLAGGTRPLSKQ